MKIRIIRIIVLLSVLPLLMTACGGGGESDSSKKGPTVSTEEVQFAFLISMSSFMMASFQSAFGQADEAVEVNDDQSEITLTNYGMDTMNADPYETISGVVKSSDDEIVCDFTLTGGPVKTLSYRLTEMESETFDLEVKANGKKIQVLMTEEDIAKYGLGMSGF